MNLSVCRVVSLSFNKSMAIHLAGPEQSKVWSVSNFHVRRDCKIRFWISTNNTLYEQTRTFTFHVLSANDDDGAAAVAAATVCDLLWKSNRNRIKTHHTIDKVRRFTAEGNAHKASFSARQKSAFALAPNANALKWNKLTWNEYH